jgi:hypothetical protein
VCASRAAVDSPPTHKQKAGSTMIEQRVGTIQVQSLAGTASIHLDVYPSALRQSALAETLRYMFTKPSFNLFIYLFIYLFKFIYLFIYLFIIHLFIY